MKVAKWGNALAIRLPIAVVKELGLKEGDQVDIRVSGERAFVVAARAKADRIAGRPPEFHRVEADRST